MIRVFLLEKINMLGNIGDIINVSAGYALYYLFPKRKALRINVELKKKFVKAYPKGSLPQKAIADTFEKFSKKKWKTLSDEEKTPWKIRARTITDRRLEEAEEKRKALAKENADDE